MPLSSGFQLNNALLFTRIEEIKKNPPPEILTYKAEHPEFKTVNCALLAEYAGVSEKTLTNLKLGKLTDCNCSTAKMVCDAFALDIRDYLFLPKQSDCNPAACHSDAHIRLDEKRQRIAELDSQLEAEKKYSARLRKVMLRESRALAAVSAALVIVVAVCIWLIYKVANPGEGIFRLK